MTQQHKHADILIAIAEGKTVQYGFSVETGVHWKDYKGTEQFSPIWCSDECKWRVKPETKKIKIVSFINTNTDLIQTFYYHENDNVNYSQKHLTLLHISIVEVPIEVYANYF